MSLVTTLRKSKILLKLYKTVFHLFSKLPKDEKLIIFESFNGRQFSDNPRAIFEHIKQHYPEYRLVWSADKRFLTQFKGHDLEIATKFSLNWLWLFPRAKYWVTNSRLPLWFPKTKDTVYVQTWHGTPLKRLGVDIEEVHMPGTTTKQYKENFLEEANKWDYLISPNPYSTDIFRRAFGFEGHMLETGYPRNDYLTDCNTVDEKTRLKQKLHLTEGKKIILYAPTWRDNEYYDKGKYKFNLQLDLHDMKKKLGDEYIVLLRLHYLVAENLDLSGLDGFAYDVSTYEDIRALYVLADLLITDYSSVFFDYSILDKPILFYVYDIETYRDQLRGFYFDIAQNAPGPLLKETKDIIASIEHIETLETIYAPKRKEFRKTFTDWEDGQATKRVVEQFLK